MSTGRGAQNLLPTRLWDAATRSRAFLEDIWPAWHAERGTVPTIPSAWTCSRSSLFLQRVLYEDYSIASNWVTGCPQDEEGHPVAAGFLTEDGWQGHSWLEVPGLIIDITADQFGLAPVIILCAKDTRYRASADLALPEFKAKRKTSLDLIWPQWQRLNAVG